MARRNLARFRLCSFSFCCKGAVIPKGHTKPNGWILTTAGHLLCPRHLREVYFLEPVTK